MAALELVMTGTGTVTLAEAPAPGPLGAYEVDIAARCSVVSPGTELAHYRGSSGNGPLTHTTGSPYPFRPGYAMVGTVSAAGAEAGLDPGQRILAHVPHASVGRFDVRQVVAVAVPDSVPDEAGPFARLAQVGGVIADASAARPGDLVAVVGLGPVGNLAAQLVRERGTEVVGVDPLAYRRDVATSCGVPAFGVEEAPAAIEARGGARVVLECSGRSEGVVLATRLAAIYGEILTVGAPWVRDEQVAATDVLAPVFERYLTLRSGWEWQVPRYAAGGALSIAGITRDILDLIGDGRIDTTALTTEIVPPAEVPAAYERLATRPESRMTFAIDWRG